MVQPAPPAAAESAGSGESVGSTKPELKYELRTQLDHPETTGAARVVVGILVRAPIRSFRKGEHGST
jgi:hypothetical protein